MELNLSKMKFKFYNLIQYSAEDYGKNKQDQFLKYLELSNKFDETFMTIQYHSV